MALALATTFMVYHRLQASVARPKLTQIVATAKDVPAGVALGAADLTLIQWPATVPMAGTFTKVEDVAGRPVLYPLGKGEPVMARDLAIPGSGIGLSVKIPPGMRATSVRSNEVVGVAGFLFPGSHVDVLATFNVPGNPNPITQTLLQDVEVLTAGAQIEPDPNGRPQTVNVVTLLLSPEDAQKLLMASTQSTIQFVLRNGADKGNEKVKPTRLDDMIGLAKPPAPPSAPPGLHSRKIRPEPRQTPVPSVYVVEVIQGQTRTEQKFPSGTPTESGANRP